ncbi:MAG: GYD domain-containing protein [Thermomicrobiales bacterium]
MPRYVSLINWTDQGVRNAKDTIQRAEQARQAIEQLGGSLEVFWTIGRYDIVGILEAPDDETATAFLLQTAGAGNIRSETLRAFTAEEVSGIIEKLG